MEASYLYYVDVVTCGHHALIIVEINPSGLSDPKGKPELVRGDLFALFKSGNNWDTGVSSDDTWVRYYYVLHKKPPSSALKLKLEVFLQIKFE